ncbi:hypothetical protein N7491_005070 [Penicillium cf. griseofulvum]|uniref:Uncharacterized protein n=1 Tax=Penicillium cf. griseofulvum TaxID=2972120 RepID=A0A9W9J2T3_9EURO|nr:hypothetical protein N7472_007763 [Penicillium cf. griseofulvum]KAJ5434475.1 hypothetical protein N7491_005070 [Penicillium cf. griseofulvum]KAJ5452305.1 hypothetical protein N7445_000488 [Penicillium cf. griseofulvum]
MSSPRDCTPADSGISQQPCDSEDYALDKEISLDKIKSADEALVIIQGSGFFNQSLYSFVVLTSVDHDIAIDLLKLIDEKYPRVRKGLFFQRKVLTLKMPSYTHEAPHAWFVQALLRWSTNGQLTPAEYLGVMITPSPRVTASNPPYTGDQKEPDTFITHIESPSLHEPRIVIEVGFGQTCRSLVEDAKLWLEGVGASVRKVLLVKFFQRRQGVSGIIELWGRNSTGTAYMIWNNRIFPVHGPFERPIYLTKDDLLNGAIASSSQGTDRLEFDITSLREIITKMGLNLVGLTPLP